MKNEIILGSANFNQKYGIKKNSISKNEIKKLFNLATKNKIKKIDTAPSYNQSEKIIGSFNKCKFKIISKISKRPKNIKNKDLNKWIKKSVITSLKNLKAKKLECLLLHDSKSLLGKDGREIYKSLYDMKIKNFTKKIGISIYDFNTLDRILKKFKFDLIQAPLNIFDQRLINSGWLKKLNSRKIEVHARSIFLQGVLLLKHNQLPKKLKKFSKHWKLWEGWLKRNKLSALQACLLFVANQRKLDGILVGCNSKEHLTEIIKFKKTKLQNNFPKFELKINNKKLTDPRKWI